MVSRYRKQGRFNCNCRCNYKVAKLIQGSLPNSWTTLAQYILRSLRSREETVAETLAFSCWFLRLFEESNEEKIMKRG